MSNSNSSTGINNALSHAATEADSALSNALKIATSSSSSSISSNTHVPDATDLVTHTQQPLSAPTDQAPNAHSQAALHAGAGIIDHAATHAHGTLPDLVSLTGHDWFIHH